jgi:pyrophosphatase PpaX
MAVLLDLDGTLLDTVPFILECVRHAFEGRPRCPSDADWIAGIGTPLRVQLSPWTEGADDLERILERYRVYQREHHDSATRAYPGAAQAVQAIREAGHPVAVVTGKLAGSARRSLVHVGMSEWVDEVVGADSCPRHKPDPEPVLLALRLLDREPREAVFVGDSPLDVAAGRAAGVATAAALWGATSREALLAAAPDHLLETVTAIPALVRELSRRGGPVSQGSP